MQPRSHGACRFLASLLLAGIASHAAANTPTKFALMQLNGDAALNAQQKLLINKGLSAAGSAFVPTPLVLGAHGSFVSKFKFTLKAQKFQPQADGVSFVVQNDPAGDMALGTNGSCLGLCGIANYAAIAFQSYSNNTVGLWLNGTMTTQPMQLGEQNDNVSVKVTYNGVTKILAFTATNSTTGETESNSYPVDLSTLGSSLYVGFTGGSGGSDSRETITQWTLGTHFKK